MRKQPNGAPGKKLPAFSVSTTQLERAAACLAGYRRQALEILSGASPFLHLDWWLPSPRPSGGH